MTDPELDYIWPSWQSRLVVYNDLPVQNSLLQQPPIGSRSSAHLAGRENLDYRQPFHDMDFAGTATMNGLWLPNQLRAHTNAHAVTHAAATGREAENTTSHTATMPLWPPRGLVGEGGVRQGGASNAPAVETHDGINQELQDVLGPYSARRSMSNNNNSLLANEPAWSLQRAPLSQFSSSQINMQPTTSLPQTAVGADGALSLDYGTTNNGTASDGKPLPSPSHFWASQQLQQNWLGDRASNGVLPLDSMQSTNAQQSLVFNALQNRQSIPACIAPGQPRLSGIDSRSKENGCQTPGSLTEPHLSLPPRYVSIDMLDGSRRSPRCPGITTAITAESRVKDAVGERAAVPLAKQDAAGSQKDN